MAPALRISLPSGDVATEVTTTSALQALRETGEAFWNPRSPALQISGSQPRSELLLIRHARRGFYVLYSSFEPHRRHLVAVQSGNFSEKWVEIWAFDKVAIVPERCFVELPVAERIVEEFFATQEPAAEASWNEFDWDLHMRSELHESWISERADPPREE